MHEQLIFTTDISKVAKRAAITPLQNTDLKNLPGERWKDVPDFEGRYKMSNYGRIKSLARTFLSKNGKPYAIPAKIVKPHIVGAKSGKTKQPSAVQAELQQNGKRYLVTLPRYIYFLFVKKFDLEDISVMVRHKDGNKLNCHYTNLELQSRSDHAKQGYAEGRRRSNFQKNIQRIAQYNADGKFVAAYPSSKAAAEATGIRVQYIRNAAWSLTRQSGGFYWRYGKPRTRIIIKR